jgi:glycosyltransferase involved in cell wall biosynthesis
VDEVKVEIDGKMVYLWEDGKSIDLKTNRERQDSMKRLNEACDMVTTTTPLLGEVYKQFNENVVAIPNCIDLQKWQKLNLYPHREVRLGWGGGISHYIDWVQVEKALPIIMEKYPDLRLILQGSTFKGALKNIHPARVETHGWVHIEAHPYKTATLGLDCAIIPLADTEFNRGKSNIKFVEYGALSIPSVISNLSPYKEAYNGHNAIMVDNDTDAWVDALSVMVEDVSLRKQIGTQAYKTVVDNYDINTQYNQWLKAYEGVLN